MNSILNNMIKFFDSGNWQKCIGEALKIIKIDKSNMQAWLLCSLSYEKLNDRTNSIICIKEALKNDEKLNAGLNKYSLSLNLAEFYRRDNKALLAISILKNFIPKKIFDQDSDELLDLSDLHLIKNETTKLDSTLFFNLAKCYADLQDYENSIKFYKIAIKIDPHDLGALFNLASSELAIGSKKNALKYYALAYDGGYLDAGINLAQIYVSLDKLDKALEIYDNLKNTYFYDSNFCFNYANFLRFSLKFEEAKKFYIQAFNINQDPRFAINLSYLLLSQNNFAQGFLFYEYRKSFLQAVDNYFLTISRDKEIIFSTLHNKNVVIYHEQGFGDSVMFARFIAIFLDILEAKKIKANIFLDIPKELRGLLTCFKNLVFLDSNKEQLKDKKDLINIPIPSLAILCDLDLKLLKNSLLRFRQLLLSNFVDAKSHCHVSSFLETKIKANKILKVGLNFASNTLFDKAKDKSIYPLDLLKKLPQLENIKYYSLQYEGLDSDLSKQFNINDLSGEIKTFVDSAKFILDCDLIISIDSCLAHLSATLGVPTILLLNKRYDWRWGLLGQDKGYTEWYDNLYFLSQVALNDWSGPLIELNKILNLYLDKK